MDKTKHKVLGLTVVWLLLFSAHHLFAWPCPPCDDCETCTEAGCEDDCSGGETCCNDSCCSNDCCDDTCCGAYQVCCPITCCDAASCCNGICCSNICCNGICCSAGQICCYGTCCDPDDCCNDEICCGTGQKCCTDSGSYCCGSDETCCNGDCCDPDTEVCCDDGCKPRCENTDPTGACDTSNNEDYECIGCTVLPIFCHNFTTRIYTGNENHGCTGGCPGDCAPQPDVLCYTEYMCKEDIAQYRTLCGTAGEGVACRSFPDMSWCSPCVQDAYNVVQEFYVENNRACQ